LSQTECLGKIEESDNMSDTENKGAAPAQNEPKVAKQLKVAFVKSSQFRVVHADGVWYEGDLLGNLHLIFYSERSAAPQTIFVDMDAQGQLIGEDLSKRVSIGDVEREIEFDAVMSFTAAAQLRAGLEVNLKHLRTSMESNIPDSVKQALKEALKQ
jgi:hypothetical protein